MAKRVTIDDLAVIVKHGFDEVHEKMDRGFAKVHERIDRFDTRMDHFESKMDRFEKRLTSIERDLAAIRFTLTELAYKDEVRALVIRVEEIEKHLGIKTKK